MAHQFHRLDDVINGHEKGMVLAVPAYSYDKAANLAPSIQEGRAAVPWGNRQGSASLVSCPVSLGLPKEPTAPATDPQRLSPGRCATFGQNPRGESMSLGNAQEGSVQAHQGDDFVHEEGAHGEGVGGLDLLYNVPCGEEIGIADGERSAGAPPAADLESLGEWAEGLARTGLDRDAGQGESYEGKKEGTHVCFWGRKGPFSQKIRD